jgi:hypothetical protein
LSNRAKNKIEISDKTVRRWLNRTEIYNKAQKAIEMGVKEVDTAFFDNLEEFLITNYKTNGSRS